MDGAPAWGGSSIASDIFYFSLCWILLELEFIRRGLRSGFEFSGSIQDMCFVSHFVFFVARDESMCLWWFLDAAGCAAGTDTWGWRIRVRVLEGDRRRPLSCGSRMASDSISWWNRIDFLLLIYVLLNLLYRIYSEFFSIRVGFIYIYRGVYFASFLTWTQEVFFSLENDMVYEHQQFYWLVIVTSGIIFMW